MLKALSAITAGTWACWLKTCPPCPPSRLLTCWGPLPPTWDGDQISLKTILSEDFLWGKEISDINIIFISESAIFFVRLSSFVGEGRGETAVNIPGTLHFFSAHFPRILVLVRVLVRAECMRQRNEVAIILGIISPLSFSTTCSEQTWSLIGWRLQRQASSLAVGS